MIPAMPTAIKFEIWSWLIPMVLKRKAVPKPVSPPVNKDGAKMPPLPPDPSVSDVAMIFKRIIKNVNAIRIQGLVGKKENKLFFRKNITGMILFESDTLMYYSCIKTTLMKLNVKIYIVLANLVTDR